MNLDKKIGYVALSVAGACLCTGLLLLMSLLMSAGRTLHVAFPRVGALRIAAAVKIDGVDAGSVARIRWKGDRAIVTINLDRDAQLRRGVRIVSMPEGIMGGRFVSIENGPAGGDTIATTPHDTLRGVFYPGVPEMMAHVVSLRKQIRAYLGTVRTLYKPDDGSQDFFTRFDLLVASIDSSMQLLDTTMHKWQVLGKKAKGFSSAMQDLRRHSARIRDVAPEYVARSSETLERTAALLERLDRTVSASASLVRRAESLQGNTAFLTQLSNVQKRITSLRDALETINKKDPALPARPKW